MKSILTMAWTAEDPAAFDLDKLIEIDASGHHKNPVLGDAFLVKEVCCARVHEVAKLCRTGLF